MDAIEQSDLISLETATTRVTVDTTVGTVRGLSFDLDGRTLAPLHTAPWLKEPIDSLPDSLIPIERKLAGDFFCAPFGASDVEPSPAHGWTANSRWSLVEQSDQSVRLKLDRAVMGAEIEKCLRPAVNAPLLYQTHLVKGGSGGLTVAHHPMVRLATQGKFSCSPKRAVMTDPVPLEADRHRLGLGVRTDDLRSVPGADGAPVDLSRLPIGHAHEDFVTLVEAADSAVGWSAVLRQTEEDVVFFLKDPRVLPVTMLWHSNAGRDYAPWNGRHSGVLGVEDGCAAGSLGHAAALTCNRLSDEGVATALMLGAGSVHRINHVIGAIPRPAGWTIVRDISLSGDVLTLIGDVGEPVTLAFDAAFFGGR